MNVALYTPEGPIFEPLRRAVHETFPRVTHLNVESLSVTLGALTQADLVLIDFSAANPLSFYFIGLADALQKNSILLAPIREILPPDFDARPSIIHAWNLDQLRLELDSRAGPANFAPAPPPADETPAGRFERLFGDLLRKHHYRHNGPVELENENTIILRDQDMDLPLVQEISHRAKSLNLRVRLL